MHTNRQPQRVMVIGVPAGGGGVAAGLSRWFDQQWRNRASSPSGVAEAPAFVGVETMEPRVLLSATKIGFIGSSSVEGIVGTNSFRRPLWKNLTNAGYNVNFVGSKNTNQNGSTPPNNDFDRENDGRSGWNADHFLNGRDGVPKLADLLGKTGSDGTVFTPDIAVIYVGHNDIFNNQTAASTANEIGQIIDVLRANNPNVTIVLGLLHNTLWSSPGYRSVPNTNPNAGLDDLNNRLVSLAQEKNNSQSRVVNADINSGFNPATMTSDGQHANASGEQHIADRFAAVIEQFLPGQVLVTPTTGLTTTEAGGKASFSVKLSKKPTDNVTINLSVSDTSEGSINKTSLTFTPSNWNTAQTVTVTGLEDSVRDGNKAYNVTLSKTQSDDPNFSGLTVPNVALTNLDDEGAVFGTVFVDLNKNGSQNTGESGLANVTVFLDLNGNGLYNPNTEPVRTTNSDGQFFFDNLSSGTYTVRVIDPDGYTTSPKGKAAHTFDLGGGQIETADFALAAEPGQVLVTPATGLTTTEGGGQASFDVRLSKQPLANVTITLSVSDATEGTINKTTLTFTPSNWNAAQTVTVTGVNDTTLDGHKTYTVNLSNASSSDPAFSGIVTPNVSLTNLDNESAIAGAIYFDANANGKRDSGEAALANVTVFLDANANGKLDAGELSVKTNTSGSYAFGTIPAGTYAVRAIAPAGYISPVGNGAAIPAPGGTTATRDFALVKPIDTAGSTTDTARNLDLSSPQTQIDEFLTAEDRVDVYRFRVKQSSKLRLILRGLDSDARLQLLDKSGRRVRNNPTLRQTKRRIDAGFLRRGVYFIRVVNTDGQDTPYRLRLVKKPL